MTISATESTLLVSSLPPRVRRKAGFKTGDEVEVRAIRGIVTLINKSPAVVSDEVEYTAEERREIDAGIAESQEEYRQGLGFGPFNTHKDFITSLHKKARKLPRRGTGKTNKHLLK